MKKFRTIIITCLAMFWPISMFAQDISEQVNIKEGNRQRRRAGHHRGFWPAVFNIF